MTKIKTTNNTKHIACDESGHTGPNLLSVDQRMFVFGSCNVTDTEAWSLLNHVKKNHLVQMPELKANKLLKTDNGVSLIIEVFEKLEDKYTININDKLLALCAWVFEYVYEPVFQGEAYEYLVKKEFHKFVAMFVWNWVVSKDELAEPFITQFQDYMRNLQPWRAPLLFEQKLDSLNSDNPFELILKFSNGYKNVIVPDNDSIPSVSPDEGKWLLDLSVSCLWSHMSYWSSDEKPLDILCDSSKPIYAFRNNIPTDPDLLSSMRKSHYFDENVKGWQLAGPIRFGDSRNHPSIQLADIVAGTARCLLSGEMKPSPKLAPIFKSLEKHGLENHSILPNIELLNLDKKFGRVGYLILYHLAQKAVRKEDPIKDLKRMYELAEQSWDNDFI